MTANPGEHENDGPADEVPADTFAVRLLLARHHAGRLSIEQAAKRCGLNSGNWANWEDGRQPRDRVEVARLVSVGLKVNFNWLLLGGPLVPARGKPTGRVASHDERPTTDTVRNLDLALMAASSLDKYPHRSVRPSDNRPKVRVDPSRPMAPVAPGRRAAPIR